MRLINTRFREHIAVKDQGSVTLGFLDADLVLADAVVSVNDMAVRLTTDGKPSVSFPRRPWINDAGEKRSSTLVRVDEVTYGRLVVAAFALPSVSRAVAKAERVPRAKSA